MRLSTTMAGLTAIVLSAVPLQAQTSLSIAGGASMPVGSAADDLQAGYNASVALTARPPLASLGIRLEGMFNSFDVKDPAAAHNDERVVAGIANATLARAEVSLRSPYIIGGLGLYNTRSSSGSGSDNNDIGFNFGLGLNLSSGVGTFLEIRYHHVPSETRTLRFIPITFGLRF